MLIIREPRERILEAEQLRVRARRGIPDTLRKVRGLEQRLPPPAAAALVDPGIAQNAEQPARHRMIRAQLIGARQGTLGRDLHEVVRILRVAREGARKPPQTRQEFDDLITQVLAG